MKLEILPDAEAVAQQAARTIARLARERVQTGNRFLFAASGGSTPWKMLRALAGMDPPWKEMVLLQTDERIAPAGDPRRNLVRMEESLLAHSPLKREQIHALPVERRDLESAAHEYGRLLRRLGGNPPVLDLVHLGLGEDGHTASLLPGDPACDSQEAIAISREYQGLRRMTMTYPTLNTARHILWVVTGANKRSMLKRLYRGDPGIPAGRVERARAMILADRDAAEGL